MYINNINIIYYAIIALIGFIVGQFVDWLNLRLLENKKIFSKDLVTIYLKKAKPNYILCLIMGIIYVVLLYFLGSGDNILYRLELIKYLLLAPMLISVLVIDIKLQIIPNRLNLTMFEVGLVFTFIEGFFNINLAINLLLGSVVGAGIFLLITIIGGIIAGKEAMGFGDVKLMGALGLYFGWLPIILLSLIAFLLGAIISIVLLATKKKSTKEYIPFGPFIVMATFLVMIIPENILLYVLLEIFTLGMYEG